MTISYYITLTLKLSFLFGLTLTILIITKLVLIPLWKLRYYKKQGIPSYFFPLLGITALQGAEERKTGDNLSYFKDFTTKNPNTKAFITNFGTQPELYLYDPKLIKEFLHYHSYYHKSLIPAPAKVLAGTGLVFAEGDLWKKNRKVIASVFHFEFLKDNIPLVLETTRGLLSKLAVEGTAKDVQLIEEMKKITGEIVGRIFFSENLTQYTYKSQPMTLYLNGLFARMGLLFRKPLVLLFFLTGLNLDWLECYREFVKDVKEFRGFCAQIIQDRKCAKTKVKDLLGLLIDTQTAANPEDRFSDDDILNEFFTFLLGGMDTAGHLIAMVLYLLHEHPDTLGKVEKEINEVYCRDKTVTYETLNRMEVTHSVIKEALRMYTPLPNTAPRTAQVDHQLGDIRIKKGTCVKAASFANGFNTEYFEEPYRFKPERWVENKEKEIEPFVFIPFLAGPRNCIGQHLAMIETKIILAEFIKMFRFKVTPENYKLHMTVFPLYHPKENIKMNLERK